MATAPDMKRVVFGGSRADLVHEYAGGFVVAERISRTCYRGISTGKTHVFQTSEVTSKKPLWGRGQQKHPALADAVEVVLLREDDKEQVFRIKERCDWQYQRGEEVFGTLGEVADFGCWYEARETAESAARRWKIMG